MQDILKLIETIHVTSSEKKSKLILAFKVDYNEIS